MRRQSITCLLIVIFLAVGFSSGCSSAAGGALSFLAGENDLTDDAKDALESVQEPLPYPKELQKSLGEPYRVEPGDVILAQTEKLDSPVRLPGDQIVLPDGTIHLGEYGDIVAAGQTLDQIEDRIQASVSKKTPDAGPISVRLISRDSKVIYVLGAVNAPGSFPWTGRETALDAILAAGGLTAQAARKKILMSRPTHPGECRIVLPVCYDNIVQMGDTSTNYQMKAGDRIFVPTESVFERIFHSKRCNSCENTSQIPCTALPASGAVNCSTPLAPIPVEPRRK